MDYLSKNIKYLRKAKNLTQEDIANIVGKARSLISAWESDDREITAEDIVKLSKYFNVPMDALVGTDLSKESNNKINDDIQVLLDAYQGLSDSDKEFMKNMIIERRKQIDKELGDNENN